MLISVIWLLVLAGAIVAILMLTSIRLSRHARDDGAILRERLALDAAIETIIGDRIINGDRSIWSRAPAEAVLDIDGVSVQARSTNEAERIDINRADPRVIDQALQRAGLTPDSRERVLGRLVLWRGLGHPIKAMADVDALFGSDAQPNGGPCIAEQFTVVFGGQLTLADIDGARQGAAQATAQLSEPLRAGAAQRLVLRTKEGMRRTVVFRIAGQRGRSSFVLDSNSANCLDSEL